MEKRKEKKSFVVFFAWLAVCFFFCLLDIMSIHRHTHDGFLLSTKKFCCEINENNVDVVCVQHDIQVKYITTVLMGDFFFSRFSMTNSKEFFFLFVDVHFEINLHLSIYCISCQYIIKLSLSLSRFFFDGIENRIYLVFFIRFRLFLD